MYYLASDLRDYIKAGDEQLKAQATAELFDSYLGVRDWAGAERLFPQVGKSLTPSEQGDCYVRMAAAAAAAGAKDKAVRLWRIRANASPMRPEGIKRLAAYGLRDDIAAFYRELVEKLPGSEAPAGALKILGEK